MLVVNRIAEKPPKAQAIYADISEKKFITFSILYLNWFHMVRM